MKQKSVKKIKAEGTQEFFSKEKTKFTFNKAPLNKSEAKTQAKQKFVDEESEPRSKKRSAFVAKLYRDEEDLDDLKVLAGGDIDSELDEDQPERKRDRKRKEKQDLKAEEPVGLKIGKLRFEKGSVALFAVSEVHENHYAIVNHTRNVKGYIDLKEQPFALEIGQFIVAQVKSVGTGQHNLLTSRNLNRKLQLTLDPAQINKGLASDKVNAGMVLQAIVESKETKGYVLNLGFKDGAKGFVKATEGLEVGSLVFAVVKTATSKVIKCELFNDENLALTVSSDANEHSVHTLKPGYLVSAKVSRLFDNGLELRFLKGMTGTVFVDHLDKHYKVGEKAKARIISVEVSSKTVTLSMLPHIVNLKTQTKTCKIGETFTDAKVEKLIYGKSFLIRLKDQFGFLHKSNIKNAEENVLDEETKILDAIALKKSKKEDPESLLDVGQILPAVRVKEFNYFDGKPVLSMREDVLNAKALNYESVQIGDVLYAAIDGVNTATKVITLKVSEFVKGIMPLEHMADHPLKVIPPKLTEVGKQIKVRVFAIDNRTIIFTKKDTFLKEKCPVFSSPAEIGKGEKLYGVVVGQTEYGFVVKSFGGVKGLLTFEEIKKSTSQNLKITDLKEGSIVKAFVLFNKKASGVALTLDKKKAKIEKIEKMESQDDFLTKFGPSESEVAQIKQTYTSLLKDSAKEDLIGQTLMFKAIESKPGFYILKTVSEKRAKIAIAPKCLVSSFGITLPLADPSFAFEGIVLELYHGVAIVTLKPELFFGLAQIKAKTDLDEATTAVGFVSKVCNKLGVTVRYFNGVTVQVAIKDLQVTENIAEHYKLGQVVSVTKNKKERFSLKTQVLHKSDPSAHTQQLQATLSAFDKLHTASISNLGLKIGSKVTATVQLVKDYGLIAAIDGHKELTGFIVNEQKATGKQYKVGTSLSCIVLDIDAAKMIVDLSERLAESKASKDSLKDLKTNHKAIVELNKEQYLILTFKNARQQVGVCIPNDFTQVNKTELYAKYQVGSEVTVRVISSNKDGFILTLPAEEQSSSKAQKNVSLEEASMVSGPVRSIKGNCLFIQVAGGKLPIIGRLHRVESFNSTEFDSFKIGDIVTAKVLRKSTDNGRVWIELTRRKQHLSAQTLDKELCNLLQLETIAEGQQVEGIVTDVAKAGSIPVSIQISAFIRAPISFADVVTVSDLAAGASVETVIAKKFKVGQRVSLVHRNGRFSLTGSVPVGHEVGSLVVVRYVKPVQGFGVTVQLDEKTFGMIELCELTDDVSANVMQQASERGIFVARIIGTDKKGRLQLSSRESVVDQKMWDLIKPDGPSAHFKTADAKRQQNCNLRNAVLKYGAKLVLQKGSLLIGYVTNISKAGCFIQVGHNTSIRAGLNELSDKQSFDFTKEMPIGRIVLARITKTEQDNTRFHASLRHSLVVYGVDQIDFSSLKPEQTVSAIVLAVADGVAFGQLKGSYYKLKIKDITPQVTAGSVCLVQLIKVVKDKLSAKFLQMDPQESGLERAEVHRISQIYASVQEEAAKDIAAVKVEKTTDLETMILRNQMDEQIRDLEDIQELEEDADMAELDSDEEEMQRIIKESKVHDSDEDDEDDEEQESEEEAESEMEGSESENSENEINSSQDEEMVSKKESKTTKPKSGKSALRSQINQEKEIRAKEAEMRSKEGAQPKTINDFERLLIADQDQSYLWIQYMAFMLEKLDTDAARRVAERAVKSVSITAENDKLNLWIAYMNLENKFGTEQQLQAVVKRAVEVNDRLKVYLQLINIYKQSDKLEYVEDIFKMLCKKHFENLSIWASYIEFLFEVRDRSPSFTAPKTILQRSLQALPKSKHIAIITKFGGLEYKHSQPESGRTMFEGVVTNYPKRMDVWAVYMDMETKYGQPAQARHLFERCLALEEIRKKPKKMKLVFRKYMEFENAQGNSGKLGDLRKRVEQYLEQVFKNEESGSSSSGESDME